MPIISCIESSASILVPYLDQLKAILVRFEKQRSICDCIIHILVLMSQIGPQSRRSILRSEILSNIDTVVILHIDHITNITNAFTLFKEMADSDEGTDAIINYGAINIAVKVIHRMFHADDKGEEVMQVILDALRVIQVMAEKGTNVMPFFLLASGYPTLIELWSAKDISLKIQQAILSIFFRLLQYEDGNEVLKTFSLPLALLGEETTIVDEPLVALLWSCIRYYVQRHGKLISSEDIIRILNAAAQYGSLFPADEVFVFHLSWTLFTLTSLGE